MNNNLVFVNLGQGMGLCANRIVSIIPSRTAQGKRIKDRAKNLEVWIDMTKGKVLATIILLDNGMVVGSNFKTETVLDRVIRACTTTEGLVNNFTLEAELDKPATFPVLNTPILKGDQLF